ncbi:MAG: phytoene desaturase family protein [Thermodesulfobacteriota bacterium]
MADYQTIVIGSGAGGLSSALYLSKNEYSVLLLEAMPSFGGYLNPFSRKSYEFDIGLHDMGELGKGQRFWSLLDNLGIADKMRFIELDPDGFYRYVFGDYEFRLCKEKHRFKERLLQAFPQESRGISKFLKVLDKITRAVEEATLMSGGPVGMIKFLLKNPVMLKYSRAPYQKLLDEVTSDRTLQAVLTGHCCLYGLPPQRASIIAAMEVLNHFLTGAYYPHGGSNTFRDVFLDALRNHGAKMKNKARVVRINKKGKEFSVETESGESFTTKAVISNADPVVTLGKLADPRIVPSKIRKKVERLRPSLGGFYAFIGTDLDLPSLGITDGTILHYEAFDVNRIYEIMTASRFQETVPFCFITSPSVKDPQGEHAPQGRHTIELITYINYSVFEKWRNAPSMKRGEEYNLLKEKIGKQLIKTAERYIPNLSEHLDHVEYASPLSNEHWVNAVKGGVFGPEQTPDQIGPGRFSSTTAGIEGLFLVGAATLGAGIMTCVASGVLAGQKAANLLVSKS